MLSARRALASVSLQDFIVHLLAACFSEIEVLSVGWTEVFSVSQESFIACSASLSNDEMHPQIFL